MSDAGQTPIDGPEPWTTTVAVGPTQVVVLSAGSDNDLPMPAPPLLSLHA
jgi:hypothetical protein